MAKGDGIVWACHGARGKCARDRNRWRKRLIAGTGKALSGWRKETFVRTLDSKGKSSSRRWSEDPGEDKKSMQRGRWIWK